MVFKVEESGKDTSGVKQQVQQRGARRGSPPANRERDQLTGEL